MKQHLRFYGTAALLVMLMLVSISTAANAARPASEAAPPPPRPSQLPVPPTHDRLGQLNWQTVSGNTARITATAGSRRSYPGFPTPPNVGDVVQFATIVFGDGQQSANQNFVCTFVDLINDWVLLEKVETHTYSNSGPFTASFGTCCRLSPPIHLNNGDQNFRAETIINFAFTSANPISQLPAIVDCPREGMCAFQVPATDPDNQLMKYRMSTTTEAGDARFVQPGPPQAPHAAVINRDTGLYTWDTHGAQINASGDTLYSTQVMIENVDFTGRVLTKTPLDFFIRLIPVTNNPPVFIYPPTPPDNTLYTVLEGTHLNFTVRARDIDPGDVVALNVIGLPAGATFPIPVPASLVESNFDWTPTGAQAGSYVLNFTATDQSSASAFTSVRINVVTNTPTVTNTPLPTHTSTPTSTATNTNTPVPPTATSTPTLPPPPPSETATALPTNTPVCNSGTPTPVVTPAFTPGPGCSSTPHHGDLDATIIDHPTTTEARFTNNSRTCSYPIGLAIYQKFDNNIDHQQLYDYQVVIIPPRTTLTLVVNNPTCAYQADAFYGNLITSFAGGVRYNERRLDDTNGNGTNYCTPGCNPLPSPVPTSSAYSPKPIPNAGKK